MSNESEIEGRKLRAAAQRRRAVRFIHIHGIMRMRLGSGCAKYSVQRFTVANIDELIERSSFGSEDAQRARRSTSEQKVAEIVARLRGIGRGDGHISSAEPSRRWRTEKIAMAGKKSGETTSRIVASQASKILSNPKSSAAAKSVAASALTQAANKGKRGK